MARYTGPKARRWRRIGATPSDGTLTAVQRRNYPPGQHGLRRGAKLSEYGTQLQEKQKAKYTYGLLERQFRRYYREAEKQSGMTGENLMKKLELRLDNVVYRLGLAATRAQARQAVTHGHVKVNGKKLDIPSAATKTDDQISLSDTFKKALETHREEHKETTNDTDVPSWLKLDSKALTGQVRSEPARSDIGAAVNEQLIVEFYSR
ncbi:30S ribosomal protein S4 [Patescibacteria group bacterium]|nr:30S ribosomal protein S4 [Patescibacteria group bacterium]